MNDKLFYYLKTLLIHADYLMLSILIFADIYLIDIHIRGALGMEIKKDLKMMEGISWGSILAGVITVLSASLLFSTLGTSLGFSITDPLSSEPVKGVATTVAIWSAISLMISLAFGAFVSGKLAARNGFIHGFLVWATALLFAVILGGMLIGSTIKATGNLLGSITSITGNIISGTSSSIGNGLSEMMETGERIFENFNTDIQLSPQNIKKNVIQSLDKSNIPTLKPEFLKKQLQATKKEIAQSLKQIAMNPNDSDQIFQTLIDHLKKRSQIITQKIDRPELIQALSSNTDLTQEEVNQIADNIIEAKEKSAEMINENFNELEEKMVQAQEQYQIFKQKALQQAAEATKAIAKSALWSFFALLLGAIVSAMAGRLGVKCSCRCSIPAKR